MTLSQIISELQVQLLSEGDARVDRFKLALYKNGYLTTYKYERPSAADRAFLYEEAAPLRAIET